MLTNIKMILGTILSLALLAGCPNNTSGEHPDEHPDTGTKVDASDPTPDATMTVVVVKPTNPLGTACSSNADCGSGFCTDGVCCDSACEQTCYACNQQAAMGHCAALTSGQDTIATSPCIGSSACLLPPSSAVPVCKLVDGTACQVDGDCVSGHCLTYYADADGDGFGGSDQGRFCEELNAPPPAGYAAYSGDCCDLDSGANPAFNTSQYLQMPDACGSYDWNCDGILEMQTPASSCPGETVRCGQGCYLGWGGGPDFSQPPLYIEACH
ncbi:MAG TPA: hypothetical protein VHO06_22810 [Polyangia bacterium]|nr:hypothetical protein [Polyangia bacterium]